MLEAKNGRENELKQQIVKSLYFVKEASYAELSSQFKKSKKSITKALNELMAEGLVNDRGRASSGAARKAQVFKLTAEALYILAVAMDQFTTRICLTDLTGRQVGYVEARELKLENNERALAELIAYLNDYVSGSGKDKGKIIGIGIGMPGFISVKKGINHTYLETGGQSLTDYLSEQTGIKTYIDNDSSLVALAEQRMGVARHKQDVMVVNIGWGIGLGMIIKGELYMGHNGFAGEFSHILISEDGEMCICGKRGCLETEASMLAVANKAIAGINEGRVSILKNVCMKGYEKAGNAVMDAALNGDQFAIELLSDAGYKIGKALAMLIHIMNPGAIVLSGRGAKVAGILLAPIQQAINKYCIPRLLADIQLLTSDLGFEAQLAGAAVLVMENY